MALFQLPRLPWLQRAQAPRRRKWTPDRSGWVRLSSFKTTLESYSPAYIVISTLQLGWWGWRLGFLWIFDMQNWTTGRASTKSQTWVKSDPTFSKKSYMSTPFFQCTVSCCTRFVALKNPNPGSDNDTLTLSDPSMLSQVYAPRINFWTWRDRRVCPTEAIRNQAKGTIDNYEGYARFCLQPFWPPLLPIVHVVWHFSLCKKSKVYDHEKPTKRL